MRKLIQFLKKFRDFLIFIVLQVFILGLFFNSKYYHKSKMINTSSGIVGWFVEKKYNITKHFGLEEANIQLMEENALLRSKMPESFYQLQSDVYSINDVFYAQQYEYIAALNLNNTTVSRDNYMTINKGRIQGVKEGMGVRNSDGIIGFVIDVSDHLAIVKTVLSEDINIPVKLSRNNENWLLKWDGKDNRIVQINGVTNDIDINKGDTVVTKGGARMFPQGIPVGFVDEINTVNGKMTLDVQVKLAVNFSSVYNVEVIRNIFAEEQKELEENIIGKNE